MRNREEGPVKVGFIGVGNMGGPMCRNIIKNTNHEVVVFDLNPAAVKECTDLGASAGSSVADVASRCEVVITSLPMPPHVEAVATEIAAVDSSTKRSCVISWRGSGRRQVVESRRR